MTVRRFALAAGLGIAAAGVAPAAPAGSPAASPAASLPASAPGNAPSTPEARGLEAFRAAEQHLDAGRYAAALPLAEAAVRELRQAHAGAHPQLAEALNGEGFALRGLGRWAEAQARYREALAMYEQTLGPESPFAANVLNNLAIAHRAAGEHLEALAAYERSLAIRRKVLGTGHAQVGQSLGNLGLLLLRMGRLVEAEPMLVEAMRLTEATQGPAHPAMAARLNNLATLLEIQGRLAEAEAMYRRALDIREAALGPLHPDTVISLNNLTGVMRRAARYGEAIRGLEETVARSERANGPLHESTGVAVNNLGLVLHQAGQSQRALRVLERALVIDEASHGPEHPSTAFTLANLSWVRHATGRTAEALPMAERALAIRQRALGPRHHDTATSMNNVALMRLALGDAAGARGLAEEALALRRDLLGSGHADTGRSVSLLAEVQAVQRDGQAPTAGASADADAASLALRHEAFAIALAAGEPELEWIAARRLMAVHARRADAGVPGARGLAIWYGRHSVATLQAVKDGLRTLGADAQRSFLRANEDSYTLLAALLAEEGRLPEAERVIELLKAHELADLLEATPAGDIKAPPAEPAPELAGDSAEARLEAEHRGRIAAARALAAARRPLEARRRQGERLPAADAAELARLVAAEAAWRDAHVEFLATAEARVAAGPAVAAVAALPGFDERLGREAEGRGSVGRGAEGRGAAPAPVAMHLVLAPDRLATLVRRPDGVAQASVRRVDRSEVQRAIGALRRALVTRGAAEVPAAALHALLLADAEPALAAARGAPLVLSLTGALRYVPFAALHDGRGWLVERHAVRMLAGASGASGASAAAPRGTGRGAPPPVPTAARIAGLGATRAHEGFPALPGVRAELEAIVRTTASPAGLLPGEIHLDEAFGAAALRQAVAGGFGFVHVASHFEFDPDDGRPSVLLLGDGTLLPLPRLAELDFRGVEQLTLSACDTASAGLGGTGAGPGGAEFEGLAALVQQRGARAVLATLWPVADASTVRLMQAYYGARGAGREGAEALRSAQLALLRGEGAAGRHAHPYFWAPFVLSTAGR